jgi:hypothetical protein
MQPNLVLWGEDTLLRCEYFLTRAKAGCLILSIHKMETNGSNSSCFRRIPDREMSLRPRGVTRDGLKYSPRSSALCWEDLLGIRKQISLNHGEFQFLL